MWMLYFVIVVYQFLDLWQTLLLLKLGAYEANPIAQYFMNIFGTVDGIYIIKFLVILFLGVLLLIYQLDCKTKGVIK